MTKLQRHVLGVVSAHHLRGLWYRAARSGERVTLASLSELASSLVARGEVRKARQTRPTSTA